MPFKRRYSLLNSQYLFTLKSALEKLFREADEKLGEDVLDIIQEIERKLKEQGDTSPHLLGKRGFEAIQQMQMDEMVLEKFEAQKKLMEEIHKVQSKCSYCGKKIPKGHDICYWCGHKKDDDEGGFFPFPFIFKPPGGGGGSMKEIAHTVKIIAQT